jgi:C-terminal processing protease CtpA/Prc
MKAFLSASLCLALSLMAIAQPTTSETDKIAGFCKIWGFLKYYHPEVAKGVQDWDTAFMNRVHTLSSLQSKEQISNYYITWINSLGKVAACKKCKTDDPNNITFNLDLDWLKDSARFTPELVTLLQYIHKNRNQAENYYVQKVTGAGNTSYDNEKPYNDAVFPAAELRLLGLARYWNIINYFYPYKYRVGRDWNTVLTDMIPKFQSPKDTLAYHMAMLELTASIHDSHAVFNTSYTGQYFGFKWAPFTFRIVDDKAIVTGILNDAMTAADDIQYGDVFLKVDDKAISDIIKEKSPYIGASNEAVLRRNAYFAIFNGLTDSVKVTFERNGTIAVKYIHRSLRSQFKTGTGIKKDTFSVLPGNIGYVNMGILEQQQTEAVLEKLRNTVAIIFDVRNYPKGTMYHVANFLNSEPRSFVKFTNPDVSYPGVYQYTPPYKCGTNKGTPYKGKVILLFNETSQSHAEFTLMALQTAPNVVSIGSQTAGADGNVSLITFPGNYKTYMTGIGVYYPDGRETQRIGIVPDIEVKPTIAGIRAKRDEVMEKAIEVAKK